MARPPTAKRGKPEPDPPPRKRAVSRAASKGPSQEVQVALLERGQRDLAHDMAGIKQGITGLHSLIATKLDGVASRQEKTERDLLEMKAEWRAAVAEVKQACMPRDAFNNALVRAVTIVSLASGVITLLLRISLK